MLKDYGFDAYGASFWRYIGITVPTIPILMFYQCGPGASTKEKENGQKVSLFDTVWPVFENDNWKTWIGLFVSFIHYFKLKSIIRFKVKSFPHVSIFGL